MGSLVQVTNKSTKDTSGPGHLLTLGSVDLWLIFCIRHCSSRVVYGQVYKQNYYNIRLPLFLVVASACALTELQWRPDRLFYQTLIDGLGRG